MTGETKVLAIYGSLNPDNKTKKTLLVDVRGAREAPLKTGALDFQATCENGSPLLSCESSVQISPPFLLSPSTTSSRRSPYPDRSAQSN